MSRCKFYHEYVRMLQCHGAHSRRKTDTIKAVTPCCDHKHSPASRYISLNAIGGAKLLVCGGDLDYCQVPEEKRADAR